MFFSEDPGNLLPVKVVVDVVEVDPPGVVVGVQGDEEQHQHPVAHLEGGGAHFQFVI